MRHFRLSLVVFAAALGLARAQDDEEKNRPPPVEIPDFSNLDEYTYTPRSTLSLGFRGLSGAKTKFYGKGTLASSADSIGDATTGNILRNYHDGAVNPDARVVTRIGADGNPVVDPGTGVAVVDPIAPDGRTNSWSYIAASQLTEIPGAITFHSYTAQVDDASVRAKEGATNFGLELAMNRDMGKLFGGRVAWSLMAGMSVNDLSTQDTANVHALIKTTTDSYDLAGAVVGPAPYTSPSSTAITVTDSNGDAVKNSDGTTQTASTDTSVLIPNYPTNRTTVTTADTTSVSTHWKLHGAYYTFRAGPTFNLPTFWRFHTSFSVGAALVYTGSTYTVEQTFTPLTGADITDTSTNTTSHVLPGYYADATVQFDLTERAGFYAGAVYQSAGAFTQHVNTDAAQYSTRIDLANQSGLRAGMTVRF